jgi:hypothetical protein
MLGFVCKCIGFESNEDTNLSTGHGSSTPLTCKVEATAPSPSHHTYGSTRSLRLHDTPTIVAPARMSSSWMQESQLTYIKRRSRPLVENDHQGGLGGQREPVHQAVEPLLLSVSVGESNVKPLQESGDDEAQLGQRQCAPGTGSWAWCRDQ